MIVKLDHMMWIAEGETNCEPTIIKDNAKEFETSIEAIKAFSEAQDNRRREGKGTYPNAKIEY